MERGERHLRGVIRWKASAFPDLRDLTPLGMSHSGGTSGGEVPSMAGVGVRLGTASAAFDHPSHMYTSPSAVTTAVRYLPAAYSSRFSMAS